jgi:hypothetical protein
MAVDRLERYGKRRDSGSGPEPAEGDAPVATVSMPVVWDELEAIVDRGAVDALVLAPEKAVDRVAGTGDLFAPVVTCVQQPLPAGAA